MPGQPTAPKAPKDKGEGQISPRAFLYVTCLVDQLYPEVGVSCVRLLRRLGVEVEFPKDQTCCGQAVFNSGFTNDAKHLARRVLDSFGPLLQADDNAYIVVPSGSCTSMMRVFYPTLFEDDPELQRQATELGSRVYELSEFLVKVLGITDVGGKYAGKVAYHPSCHLLRELEVEDEPVQLLKRVEGIDLVGVDEARTCCGFGGTFSVKYPHISEGMLEDKLENLKASGATTLVGCDVSCLMHMEGALRRRGSTITPLHLAQVLESAEE